MAAGVLRRCHRVRLLAIAIDIQREPTAATAQTILRPPLPPPKKKNGASKQNVVSTEKGVLIASENMEMNKLFGT